MVRLRLDPNALEPGLAASFVEESDNAPGQRVILALSLAISAKRIADYVEKYGRQGGDKSLFEQVFGSRGR